MNEREFLLEVIDPALAGLSEISGKPMGDDRARVLMLAIALQESGLRHRRQVGGPARGWWQFEQGGACTEVTSGPQTHIFAAKVCDELLIPGDLISVFEALAWNNDLAAAYARLLLWSDKYPLPAVGEVNAAWDYYQRNWRPGKPHPEVWPSNYAIAVNSALMHSATAPKTTTAAEYFKMASTDAPATKSVPEETGARNSSSTSAGVGAGLVIIWLWNSLLAHRFGLPEMPAEVGGVLCLLFADLARNFMPRTGALKSSVVKP